MKALAFSLLIVSSAAAFAQARPEAASRLVLERDRVPMARQVPETTPMKTMQAPMAIGTDPALTALVQKQTAAILELSNRIKVLDARIAKLEEKGK